MTTLDFELILILCVTAITATLPGIFLVLRGVPLVSDVLSHCILPGIIISFVFTQNLLSPFLFVGAVISAMSAILIIERIIQTGRVQTDAALGLVYPAYFAVGVLLINSFAQHTHLDMDIVLFGDVAFTPFNRFILGSYDCGPIALWLVSSILVLNCFFFIVCYKQLRISIFDPVLAQLVGISPSLLYYLVMILSSITIIGGLQIVGSVVIGALMIVPPATAQLISSNVTDMIIISILVSIATSLYGYFFAMVFDVSIGGSIALLQGIAFVITLWITQKK